MSTIQLQEKFSGKANIWHNKSMNAHFVTLGTVRDKIPCPAHALVEITHESIERSMIFEAKITKQTVREDGNYFVKMIRIPSRYNELIPMNLKNINYNIEILP